MRQPRSCWLRPWLSDASTIQTEHKYWGQVVKCYPFLVFMSSLATFRKHSSLEKTCRTNENVDSVDSNL